MSVADAGRRSGARLRTTRLDLAALGRTRESGLAALMVLVTLAAIIAVPPFRTATNFGELLNGAAITVVLAVAESLVLLTRQIDLSVGTILGLAAFICGALASHLAGLGPLGLVFLSLAIGAVLGVFNGVLITLAKMPAIIATLATLSIYGGLQVVVSGGSQVYASQLPTWLAQLYVTSWLGIGSFIVIAVLIVAVTSAILRLTRWGRDLYAMGSNPEAAMYIGISTRRRTVEAFVVCGALSGFAGLLYAAQYGNVDATAGTGYELTAIAAAVVGGVSLFGGSGSPLGAGLGALLLLEIENILAVLKISIFAQQTLQGIAIVVAVAIYAFITRRMQRPSARVSLPHGQQDGDGKDEAATSPVIETEVSQ